MHDREFEAVGARLVGEGLVAAVFGNLSVRGEDGFRITRTGCRLDEPGEGVDVPFDGSAPLRASSEYRVHRAVYARTGHRAIVHAHPVHAVAASLLWDAIAPLDSEGELLCPLIPVVAGPPGTEALAEAVADGLTRAPVVVARGHGTFAAGASLEDAALYTSLAEHSCRVLVLLAGVRGRT